MSSAIHNFYENQLKILFLLRKECDSMDENKKMKLSERTAERLYAMIAEEGLYPAGSKLPNENELSGILNVSRTTLRAAISLLSVQGILEIRRGTGTFVCENLPAELPDLTALEPVHSRERARDLFEMRRIFEPETVALACERASDAELQEIVQLADDMERIAAEGGDWPKGDQAFHQALIHASHNLNMQRLYPIINHAVNEILQVNENREHMLNVAVQDNRLIVEFLLKRDAAGAREAMSIHMRHLLAMLS